MLFRLSGRNDAYVKLDERPQSQIRTRRRRETPAAHSPLSAVHSQLKWDAHGVSVLANDFTPFLVYTHY